MIVPVVLGGLALFAYSYVPKYLMQTSTGLDNRPKTKREKNNLAFLNAQAIPMCLAICKRVDPRFKVTSVFRSEGVNRAVGGNSESYHRQGLAFDLGGLSELPKEERDTAMLTAAAKLRNNDFSCPWLREVIVETWRNHIHIACYSPDEMPAKGCKWLVWSGPKKWSKL